MHQCTNVTNGESHLCCSRQACSYEQQVNFQYILHILTLLSSRTRRSKSCPITSEEGFSNLARHSCHPSLLTRRKPHWSYSCRSLLFYTASSVPLWHVPTRTLLITFASRGPARMPWCWSHGQRLEALPSGLWSASSPAPSSRLSPSPSHGRRQASDRRVHVRETQVILRV